MPATLADALIEAHSLHEQGLNDQARILLLAIIEQSPEPVASALMLLGRIARTEGRAAEAADWLAAAVDAEPAQPLPRVALAELALARGMPEEAEELLRQALSLDHACVPALIGLGLAQLARGRRDEAEASFRAATGADPGSAAAHFHLGNALLAGAQPLPAEASFRRALRLAPEDSDTAAALGLSLRAQGQDAEARPFLERAAATGSAPHLSALGDVLATLGDAEAASAYDRALQNAPDFVPAHEGLARLALAAHDTRKATACFRRALALEPEAWPLELGLGNALRATGSLDEARACFARAAGRPEAAVQMALTDLLDGRWAEGWAVLAEEWRSGRLNFSPLDPPGPRWDGGPLPDQALLVDCGLDPATAITLMGCLPIARQRVGRLVLVCRPDLRRLLAALPGVDAAISEGEVPGGYAAHAAIEVLPALLGLDRPPAPPAVPVGRSDWQRWQARLHGQAGLGVIRRGAAHALGAAFDLPRLDLSGFDLDNAGCRDFADMAAALAQFDRVVGADGPALRLAAALGVPCLAVIPAVGDWVWGGGGRSSDWLSSAHVMRWKIGDEIRLMDEILGFAQGVGK